MIATPFAISNTQTVKVRFWAEQCEESFQSLKERLIYYPILCVAIGEGQIIVKCDASNNRLGCVLM